MKEKILNLGFAGGENIFLAYSLALSQDWLEGIYYLNLITEKEVPFAIYSELFSKFPEKQYILEQIYSSKKDKIVLSLKESQDLELFSFLTNLGKSWNFRNSSNLTIKLANLEEYKEANHTYLCSFDKEQIKNESQTLCDWEVFLKFEGSSREESFKEYCKNLINSENVNAFKIPNIFKACGGFEVVEHDKIGYIETEIEQFCFYLNNGGITFINTSNFEHYSDDLSSVGLNHLFPKKLLFSFNLLENLRMFGGLDKRCSHYGTSEGFGYEIPIKKLINFSIIKDFVKEKFDKYSKCHINTLSLEEWNKNFDNE